jgi:hypothetical protein
MSPKKLLRELFTLSISNFNKSQHIKMIRIEPTLYIVVQCVLRNPHLSDKNATTLKVTGLKSFPGKIPPAQQLQ